METKLSMGSVLAESSMPGRAGETILRIEGLRTEFLTRRGAVTAVRDLDLELRHAETLGLVGESGCGKTTTGRLITRLLEPTGGRVEFEGRDITHSSVRALRPLHRDIAMVFQDPYSALNPRHTIGTIVAAPYRIQGIEPPGGSTEPGPKW